MVWYGIDSIVTLRRLFWQITNQLKKEFARQKKERK